jgi:hypothetical protein
MNLMHKKNRKEHKYLNMVLLVVKSNSGRVVLDPLKKKIVKRPS